MGQQMGEKPGRGSVSNSSRTGHPAKQASGEAVFSMPGHLLGEGENMRPKASPLVLRSPHSPSPRALSLTLAGLGGYLALLPSSFRRDLTRQERRWEKVSKLFLPW